MEGQVSNWMPTDKELAGGAVVDTCPHFLPEGRCTLGTHWDGEWECSSLHGL